MVYLSNEVTVFSQRDREWVSATKGEESGTNSHIVTWFYLQEMSGGGQLLEAESGLVTMGKGEGLRRERAREVMQCSLGYTKVPYFVVCSFTELANPAPSTNGTSVTISCCLLAASPNSSELSVFLQQ